MSIPWEPCKARAVLVIVQLFALVLKGLALGFAGNKLILILILILIISIWNLDSASVAERLHANFAGTSVSKSITAASVSAESYASVLAKTEAASHTTKRPAARSTTPKSSSETKTSPESVAAPVIAGRKDGCALQSMGEPSIRNNHWPLLPPPSLPTNSTETFVSTTAVSVSTESYASVLAKSAPRFRGGAFSENPESSRSKTEAASHTTKRPDARSTTPKSSSETKTSASPESVAAPVIAERLPTNSTETSVSTTAVSVSAESCASVLAKRESVKPMIEKAIKVGKYYGLNLKEGIPNMADGNCAIETTLDQLDKRPEFEGHRVPGEPQFYRKKWFSEIERDAWGTSWSERWSLSRWKSGWKFMQQPGIYEHELGDIVMHGIAHCNSVDILIINTLEKQGLPYCVIPASALCGRQATTEVPIILAYNEVHYEGLLPVSEVDIQKSIELKQQYLRSVEKDQISKIPALVEIYRPKSVPVKSPVLSSKRPLVESQCPPKSLPASQESQTVSVLTQTCH